MVDKCFVTLYVLPVRSTYQSQQPFTCPAAPLVPVALISDGSQDRSLLHLIPILTLVLVVVFIAVILLAFFVVTLQ